MFGRRRKSFTVEPKATLNEIFLPSYLTEKHQFESYTRRL